MPGLVATLAIKKSDVRNDQRKCASASGMTNRRGRGLVVTLTIKSVDTMNDQQKWAWACSDSYNQEMR